MIAMRANIFLRCCSLSLHLHPYKIYPELDVCVASLSVGYLVLLQLFYVCVTTYTCFCDFVAHVNGDGDGGSGGG